MFKDSTLLIFDVTFLLFLLLLMLSMMLVSLNVICSTLFAGVLYICVTVSSISLFSHYVRFI